MTEWKSSGESRLRRSLVDHRLKEAFNAPKEDGGRSGAWIIVAWQLRQSPTCLERAFRGFRYFRDSLRNSLIRIDGSDGAKDVGLTGDVWLVRIAMSLIEAIEASIPCLLLSACLYLLAHL